MILSAAFSPHQKNMNATPVLRGRDEARIPENMDLLFGCQLFITARWDECWTLLQVWTTCNGVFFKGSPSRGKSLWLFLLSLPTCHLFWRQEQILLQAPWSVTSFLPSPSHWDVRLLFHATSGRIEIHSLPLAFIDFFLPLLSGICWPLDVFTFFRFAVDDNH